MFRRKTVCGFVHQPGNILKTPIIQCWQLRTIQKFLVFTVLQPLRRVSIFSRSEENKIFGNTKKKKRKTRAREKLLRQLSRIMMTMSTKFFRRIRHVIRLFQLSFTVQFDCSFALSFVFLKKWLSFIYFDLFLQFSDVQK